MKIRGNANPQKYGAKVGSWTSYVMFLHAPLRLNVVHLIELIHIYLIL